MKKKHSLLLVFMLLICLQATANRSSTRRIILHQGGQVPTHYDLPMPDDVPDVYYDSATQSIIIDGSGCVSYYDVEITSLSSWTVYVSTQVSGYYDSIDISSLPQDDYVITIDSPLGNSYEGFFDTY